jgi:oligosaccharyltransferase complex subunit beta
MKTLFSFLVLLFAAIVHALSTAGDRLLIVLDDVAEKEGYSQFFGDLESRLFVYSA